ncbi:LysE/ArgO family amino acid transporter [Ottowia thiooxydans]|uniref:L-lysine exporter family protein LysE/ArgO n=1 Tax=Ottowia thiooxydans TaxID=219182 RepID=A0ABV2Q6R4_9BURK
MFLTAATAGFLTGAGLIVAIGSQNAFVLRQGLKHSHVGLVVAVCAIGDIALILAGVGGMGAIIREWPDLLELLRLGGAAFIGWNGLQAALRAWRGGAALSAQQSNEKNWRRVLLAGLAFTFLNPHAYIDTMVLIGSLSTRYTGDVSWAFGLGACVASVVWFAALGFGARLLQPAFRNPMAWRVLDASVAVSMLMLCVLLLLRPLH